MMIRLTGLLIVFLVSTTLVVVGQDITGKWEHDYASVKDCDGNEVKYLPEKYGKNTLEFFENGHYTRFTMGYESGGNYVVEQHVLELNEQYNLSDAGGKCDRGEYELGIEKIKGDTLVISFYECDEKVLQNFIRKRTWDQESHRSSIRLELNHSPGSVDGKTDVNTLSVTCMDGECTVTWQGKVITQESHYGTATGFISSMEAFGCRNMFVLSVYHGDGCPGMYRILEFKNDSSYFLSEVFGNCDAVEVVRVDWPIVEFGFTAKEKVGIPGKIFVYDRRTFSLMEK